MGVLREVVECRLSTQIKWTERIERKGGTINGCIERGL